MKKNKNLYNQLINFLPYIILFFCCCVCLSNFLLSPYWIYTHEETRYLVLMEAFKRVFSHGFLYPRWLTDIYGGYGYPTFVFYQPMFFFCSLPFNLILPNAFLAVKATVLLLFFIGSVGAYKIAKLFVMFWWQALVVAILFLLTPYLYLDLFVRGALGELCVVVFIPWSFYYLVRLERAIKEKSPKVINIVFMLGLAFALILYSHLPVSMIFFPSLMALILAFTFFIVAQGNRWVFVVNFIGAVVIGFALSSPYWLLCLSLQDWVHWEFVDKGLYDSVKHIVYWPQLFINFWGFGASGPGMNDQMSFQLGAMHFIVALLGLIVSYKNRFICIIFFFYTILLSVMCIWWIPLVKVFPFIGKIQFPWRILSITSTLQMIAAIGVLVYLQRFKWQRQIVFILVFLLLVVVINFKQFIGRYYDIPYWYTPAIFTAVQKTNIDPCGGLNEFLPRTAPFELIPPRADSPILLSLRGMQLTARSDNSDYKIHYQAMITAPDILIINQLYFPGWKVIVNDIVLDPKVLEKSIEPMGRIAFLIQKPGEYDIKAFYAGPPYKMHLYGAIVIIMGFSLFILIHLNRRFLWRN